MLRQVYNDLSGLERSQKGLQYVIHILQSQEAHASQY